MDELNNRPLVGLGVLVMRGGRVLLGRRRGAHGAGYFAAPGGHLEWGESFAAAVRREVREETGLEITEPRLLSVGSYFFACPEDANSVRHYVDVDFVCEAPTGEPQRCEPEKCDGWAWYALDALPQPLFIVTVRMIESWQSGVVLVDPARIERQ